VKFKFEQGSKMTQTAKDLLEVYGLGVADAAAFINSNLQNPQVIFDTAKKFGITNQHLSEITGYKTDVIQSFWSAHGLQPALLDVDASVTKVNLVEIAIQKYIITHEALDFPVPSSQPLSRLNADTGAFKFIVDFNDYKEGDHEIGRFEIKGFGSDDSFEIHSPGSLLVSNFFIRQTVDIDVRALGGLFDGNIEILLTGLPITSHVESVQVFNHLPIGNIDIV
jgi:hypothetical protein